MIFAGFQLLAANAYSFPIFTLVVNAWLLGILYRVDEGKKTLKEINREVFKNVKEELANVKKNINRGKK